MSVFSLLGLEKMWGLYPRGQGKMSIIINKVTVLSVAARKEEFKKRTVAEKDRGYRIVGAFVKI